MHTEIRLTKEDIKQIYIDIIIQYGDDPSILLLELYEKYCSCTTLRPEYGKAIAESDRNYETYCKNVSGLERKTVQNAFYYKLKSNSDISTLMQIAVGFKMSIKDAVRFFLAKDYGMFLLAPDNKAYIELIQDVLIKNSNVGSHIDRKINCIDIIKQNEEYKKIFNKIFGVEI